MNSRNLEYIVHTAGISHYIEVLFNEIDYNLLFIFIGLFIVSGAFVDSGVPRNIWNFISDGMPFQSALSTSLISLYTVVASQLGNYFI